MQLSRRTFLSGFSAAAAVPGLFAAARLAHDPDLTVLLSDIHVPGELKDDLYSHAKFARVVADILRMDPLPARAVIFGDLAWLHGQKADYLRSAPEIKLLRDAGIAVTIGMGNHDRRSAFLEVYPEHATTTKIPGRIVNVCDAGAVDFLMLDGLQGTDDRPADAMGPVAGLLCKDQQDWLAAALPKWKKPVFVCSHFPVKELTVGGKPLAQLLHDCPAVAGYIHGHDHRWYKTYPLKSWTSSHTLRTLCLPSTGFWGDIGFTTMRTTPGRAVAALHEYEYFFPTPKAATLADATLWKDICTENQHQTCTFLLPKGV